MLDAQAWRGGEGIGRDTVSAIGSPNHSVIASAQGDRREFPHDSSEWLPTGSLSGVHNIGLFGAASNYRQREQASQQTLRCQSAWFQRCTRTLSSR